MRAFTNASALEIFDERTERDGIEHAVDALVQPFPDRTRGAFVARRVDTVHDVEIVLQNAHDIAHGDLAGFRARRYPPLTPRSAATIRAPESMRRMRSRYLPDTPISFSRALALKLRFS